jgi:hypothetical protein
VTQKDDYEAVRQTAEAAVDAVSTKIGALLWKLVLALLVWVAVLIVGAAVMHLVSLVRSAL